MENEINNPHDNLFKAIFADKKRAKELIKFSLPPDIVKNIDLSAIEIEDNSMIDEELKTSESDLLLSCRYKNRDVCIYMLFEHKSTPDKYTYIQLLGYIVKIWKMDIKNNRTPRILIPIVFYHGRREWKVFDIVKEYENVDSNIVRYVPKFEYVLTNVGEMSDEEIRKKVRNDVLIRSAILIMRHIFDGDDEFESLLIDRLAEDLRDIIAKYNVMWLRQIFTYVFNKRDLDIDRIVKKIKENNVKEAIMTTAQVLIEKGKTEGLKEGLTRGKMEGLREGIYKTARRMYEEGFDLSVISRVTGLTLDEVEKIVSEK